MRTIALIRCTSGHLFAGRVCPIDGWISAESDELAAASERLGRESQPLSIERLRAAGVSEPTLKRTWVVEIGDDETRFEAIVPAGYVVGRALVPLAKLPGEAFR